MSGKPILQQYTDHPEHEVATHHSDNVSSSSEYYHRIVPGNSKAGSLPSPGAGKLHSSSANGNGNGALNFAVATETGGDRGHAIVNSHDKLAGARIVQGLELTSGEGYPTKQSAGPSRRSPATSARFPILFEPKSLRSWGKSRKLEEGHGTGQSVVPSWDDLNAQLRPEEDGLVPLNAIAGRVVHYAWQLFANQVEINPSITPLERRKRIYEDAHEARKQLIKLLVLVQWSKVAPELQVARSLIATINDHISQTDAAVSTIAETRGVLSNARLRNYDLVTAIEVLSRGSPQRVPPSVKDFLQAAKPFTDVEAIDLVHKLDDALRLRLASEEMLAMPMLSYRVGDGRACFSVNRLFEADLTLSGPSADDRWWLLRTKFDFRISGAGAEKFPRQLRGQQRLNLLSLADSELAPRSVAAAARDAEAGEETQPGSPLGHDATGNAMLQQRRDAPLVRLYNLLQSQALHYQLDILHWQAAQLVRLSWDHRLMVFFDVSRVLHLRYWRNTRTVQEGRQDEWDPCSRAEVCISVAESEHHCGSITTIKSLFEKNDDRGEKPVALHLVVEWDIQGVALDFLGSRELAVDHQALDAEALLLDVVHRHAHAAIQAFCSRIKASSLSKTMQLQIRSRRVDSYEEPVLLIVVHERLSVGLSIDRLSGQIQLEEHTGDDAEGKGRDQSLSCASLASLTRLNYVRDASRAINERPRSVVGVLQKLRCQILLDDLEEKCALAGLSCSKRMPLRKADYAQLNGASGSFLFVAMQQCPSYYLVLHVSDESIRVALMCAGTFLEEMITSMRIISLERLDWMHVLRSHARARSSLGKRKRGSTESARSHDDSAWTMSEEDLAVLHSYSVALISYHKVEEQLRQRGVPFLHVGGLTCRQAPMLGVAKASARSEMAGSEAEDGIAAIIPVLCIDAQGYLGHNRSAFVKKNILLRLRNWCNPSKSRVELMVKLALRSDVVTQDRIVEGSDEIRFDAKTGIMTFSIADIDGCFTRFLMSWRRIEKVLDLIKVLWCLQRQGSKLPRGNYTYALQTYDMIRVSFCYGDGLVAQVGWVEDLTRRDGGRYALSFFSTTSEESETNPHSVMREVLQDALNQGRETNASFWPDFLHLLQRTLPIARTVHRFPEECLEDVDVPELDVKTAGWLRLTFLDRFVLDVRLLTGNRALFHDAGRSTSTFVGTKPDARKPTSTDDVQDDFTLSMQQGMAVRPANEAARAHEAQDWAGIPSFDKIVGDMAKAQPPLALLAVGNALFHRGDPGETQTIMRQLIDRIRAALQ